MMPVSPGSGDLIIVLAAVLGTTGYVYLAATGAAIAISFGNCGLGRDQPYLDLYIWVPLALAALTLTAWGSSRYLPAAARIARLAASVSAGLWVWSVGVSRGWW